MSGRTFWPWRRHEVSPVDIEESRRALAEAKEWAARSRRVARAADRAIVQNHFAADLRKAMES